MMYGFDNMWNYIIVGLIILFIIALYVSKDATRRGYNGTLWALVVILMPMMGIFFYLVFIGVSPYQIEKSRYFGRQTVTPASSGQHVPGRDFTNKANTESIYCTACGIANDPAYSYCKNCGVGLL